MAGIDLQEPALDDFPRKIISGNANVRAFRQNHFKHKFNHYCEYMGYALPENKIVCGLCGTENPAGTTNCVKCGKPLIIPCPACSAENNNSAKVCAKCGFDLTKMDKAVELLRQAKQKYSEKALEEAERLVKEAKAYWPNHADVLGLEKTIQDERKQAADTIAAIMKDIQDKKMYAAQTKIDQAKANGFSIDPSVASKVTAVLKEVESQLAIMRNASGDEAFTIAMKLTELIADSDELNQSLKKFPPDEVPAVSSKRVGDEITLTWKPRRRPNDGNVFLVGLVYIWLQPKEATKLRRNFTNLSSVTYVRLTRMDY